jgi:hypothetical protein
MKESRLPGSTFAGAAEIIVARFAAAILVAGLSLGRPDCFFRAKSEKLLGRSLTYFNLIRIT